jgi:hypothetical protein
MKNLFLIFLLSFFFTSCTKVLTNTSKTFLDVQSGLLENTNTLNKVAIKVDKMADLQKDIAKTIGLETSEYDKQRSVSAETKELLAIIKSNDEQAKKDREANAEILKGILSALKVVAPVAGSMVGIPPQVTSAGLSITDALLGAGGTGVVVAGVKELLASRRKRKEDEEWQKHCEDLEKEALKEKEEMKKSLLIKMKTAGKMPAEHMALYDEKKLEAMAELKAEGKI